MTIRGGGSPRDPRGDGGRPLMAHPIGDEPALPLTPRPAAPAGKADHGRGHGRRTAGTVNGRELAMQRRGHSGLGGLLRIALFLTVLAVVVLVLLLTVLRPLVRGAIVGWAGDNPSALGIGFVADLVREDLGPALTAPAGTSDADVPFTVQDGDTAATIAVRLRQAGVLADSRAFVLISLQRNLATHYQAGQYVVRQTMTPDQLATALLTPTASNDPHLVFSIRSGLRLEQITALIQAKSAERGLAALQMDAKAFLDLVRNPPASLLKDYPWLVIPKGGTLEGYLAAGDYTILPDITPDQLVRAMLDRFYQEVGPERLIVAKARGLTWYQVLTMASIVEEEARLDSERARIAGVLQNRLAPHTEAAGFLGSDVTVFYENDTLQLAKLPVAKWVDYSFWGPFEGTLPTDVPPAIAAYNTYTTKGLPPAPICTPTVVSIDAALTPDTKGGYLYFLATKSGTTVFAKTYAEHQANIKKYGG